MSKNFSRSKEKRLLSSSNEINTSFVKNVTSRVSGLLPATITKWFSSPSSSNANGSTATAEATDSSTEDEGPESPVVTQPPAKRMRFNAGNKFNHFGLTDGNCTTSKIEITEVPVSPFPGSQFSTNRNSVTLTPVQSPNETFSNEALKDKSERDASRFKSAQHTVSSIGLSVAAKRKSIFDKTSNDAVTETNTKPSTSEKKRPCFKPTLLGSPFYPGRTIYGGAASSYINQPNVQKHTVASVNETKSNEDSAMSTSTRRIMELLETYSSPLMEARRIPHYTKPKNESFNMSANQSSPHENTRFSYKTQELHVPSIASILRLKQRSRLMDSTKAARQIIASHSSASSYPLPYPTIAINKSATSNTCHTNQEVEQRPQRETEQNNKMTTKVKTRVARTNRGHQDEVEIATPVKLPSATLQIDQNKLPKFSFDAPAIKKLPATSTLEVVLPVAKPIEIKNDEISTSKPETIASSSVFKFSNPVKISYDSPEPETTPPIFTFDSPERRIDQHFDYTSDVSSVVGRAKETDKSTAVKDWVCPECWVNNKFEVSKCVCCGYIRIKDTKCYVCRLADSQAQKDKCINCEKMASSSLPKSSQPPKWICDDCWVMNECSVEKCLCCGASKPTEASKVAKAAAAMERPELKLNTLQSTSTVTPNKFGTWPSNSDPKNVTSLPSTSTSLISSGTHIQTDSTFVGLAKTQKSDKWECSSCLVRNESDKLICVCCGVKKDVKNMTSPSSSKSSQRPKWKCDDCWVMNEDSVEKCSCCFGSKPIDASKAAKAAEAVESAKVEVETVHSSGGCFTVGAGKVNPDSKNVKSLPSTSTIPSFFGSHTQTDSTFVSLAKTQKSDKWECSSCLVRNDSDKSVCVCCGAEKDPKNKHPETKFNFGLKSNTSFKFGIDPKEQQATLAKKSDVPVIPEAKLKQPSETNNNVLAETPTFGFAFTPSAEKRNTKIATEDEKPTETVKFNFGIPKNENISTKSEPSKIVHEDKEKLQEVPEVNFATAVEEKQKGAKLFDATLTHEVEKGKISIPPSNMFTLPPVEVKKDAPSNTIILQTAVTSVEKTEPQNTFTLGSSVLKPTTNFFGIPSTVSNSTNLFASPGQNIAVTTCASTTSIMSPLGSTQKNDAPSALPVPDGNIFSLSGNRVNNTIPMPPVSAAVPAEKPKFQFTFGMMDNVPRTESTPSLLATSSNTQSVFKPHFAPISANNSKKTNTFSLTTGNTLVTNNTLASSNLGGTNGISATNGLVGNTLPGTAMGGNALSPKGLSGNLLSNNTMANNTFGSNTLTSGNGVSSTSTLGGTNGLPGIIHSGNSLQASNPLNSNSLSTNPPNIFGSAVQKENMWNPNPNNSAPSTNLFVSNASTNTLTKPATFTFGTSTQFNATTPSSAFGNNAQTTQNIFGMANQNNPSQPSLFSNPVTNQAPTPMFGSPQPNSNSVPQLGMFGTPNLGATPAFGTPNASLPSFEAPSMNPTPPATFTFGAAVHSTPVFGFGQQQPQQQQQEQTGGSYSFAPQQVQFNMGSMTQNNPTRRIKRAARRNQR